MNDIKACIFPDTVPTDDRLFPLVQVFGKVVYCQPVEHTETEAETQASVAIELINSGTCSLFAPAPLGSEKDRFLSLTDDLRNRRDDYAGQLGYLALAGLGNKGNKQQETKSSIIESLLQSKGIDAKRVEKRELLLWQARLLLKLGEQFDAEQAELNRELAGISRKQKGLITELRREQEETFSLTRSLNSSTGRTDGMQTLRLKAWSRLFCLGNPMPEKADVFVTANQDAADRMAEEYELLKGNAPKNIMEVLLPALGKQNAPTAKQAGTFRVQAKELLRTFAAVLGGEPEAIDTQQLMFTDPRGDWTGLLEQTYPADDFGRCRLTLLQYPEISAQQLFMESFGRDEDTLQTNLAPAAGQGVII
ncbi:MAG: hypothetical protein GQ559_09890, partial [Desulfobulbaceae bacterium]|nr:hypothetical protein [Desulfobulbaceae bacterium]